MPTNAHDVYHSQMAEAKIRILAAERVSAAAAPVTGLPSLDCEFCFLQVRRIIELITFAGMVREEQRYRQFRETEPRRATVSAPDPTKDWNAKEILSRLVKLSPHMLPIPLGALSQTALGVMNFDRAKLTVNHGKLIELYNSCSVFMHASNPLVTDFHAQVEQNRARYKKAPDVVKEALVFLRKLLWLHAAVQLEWTDPTDASSADNPSSAWIVDFSSPLDDVVSMTLATSSESDPT